MKNVTDSFVFLGHWSLAGTFGFNTDILATNLINLIVVIGVLIFFGKGVCASCLFREKVGFIRLHFLLFFEKPPDTEVRFDGYPVPCWKNWATGC